MFRIILVLSFLFFYHSGVEVEARGAGDHEFLHATSIIDTLAENRVFKDIEVSGNKGTYTVTGQVRAEKGEFFYSVEDGHNEFVGETRVKSSSVSPNGFSFKVNLSFPVNKLPENGVLIMNLYEKSKSGEILHNFPIVLETFKPSNKDKQG